MKNWRKTLQTLKPRGKLKEDSKIFKTREKLLEDVADLKTS